MSNQGELPQIKLACQSHLYFFLLQYDYEEFSIIIFILIRKIILNFAPAKVFKKSLLQIAQCIVY